MKPRRVVIVNDASRARGGATGLALLSARLLRQRGIEVTYVAGDMGENETLRLLGVEIVAVGGRQLMEESRLRAARSGLYNRAARDVLAGVVARHDAPDTAYHVHGWSKILSPSVFDALAPVAARTVVHAHDFFLACPNGGYMDYQAMRPCERRPLGASCIATHCDKRSYLQKSWRVARAMMLARSFDPALGWNAIAMIHPAMAPLLMRAGYPARLLRTLRNPVTPFTAKRVQAERNAGLLFVGRLDPEKGVEDAIAAAARADMPLTVAGDGPLLDRLARAHPEVTFLGWTPRAALAGLVAQARALVMPSRYPEPFGLVAVEAVQSGLPVILSHSAFLANEIVRNGLGFCCDTRDHAAFGRTAARLRDMPEPELRGMSRRGHARTAPLATSPDEWATSLLDLYATDRSKAHA